MIGIKKRKNTELSKEMNGQIPQTVKKSISSDKASKVHRTIHGASITAAGVGALPIPIADALILVPIQLKMLKNIYKVYQSMSFCCIMSLSYRITFLMFCSKSTIHQKVLYDYFFLKKL